MFSNRIRSTKRILSKSLPIIVFIIGHSGWTASIIVCHDGDTCKIERENKLITVRLAGIDAPETGQEGAIESRDFLLKLTKGKKLILACHGLSYGREVCKITVDGKDVQREMVRNGWALDYPKYSQRRYANEQTAAKKEHLGVWAQPSFVSPFCYNHTGVKDCNADATFQP
jgi:micrococcal nuclease